MKYSKQSSNKCHNGGSTPEESKYYQAGPKVYRTGIIGI